MSHIKCVCYAAKTNECVDHVDGSAAAENNTISEAPPPHLVLLTNHIKITSPTPTPTSRRRIVGHAVAMTRANGMSRGCFTLCVVCGDDEKTVKYRPSIGGCGLGNLFFRIKMFIFVRIRNILTKL